MTRYLVVALCSLCIIGILAAQVADTGWLMTARLTSCLVAVGAAMSIPSRMQAMVKAGVDPDVVRQWRWWRSAALPIAIVCAGVFGLTYA